MKFVSKVETFDGIIHDSVEDAQKYLDAEYNIALSDISNALAYQSASHVDSYISKNIEKFAALIQIKNDKVINE